MTVLRRDVGEPHVSGRMRGVPPTSRGQSREGRKGRSGWCELTGPARLVGERVVWVRRMDGPKDGWNDSDRGLVPSGEEE